MKMFKLKLRNVSLEIKSLEMKISELFEPMTLEFQPNNLALRDLLAQLETARKLFETRIHVPLAQL